MDIISYGTASKAGKQEEVLRMIVGEDAEGLHPHVKGRIDSMQKSVEAVNGFANNLIVTDAVNIMKAHAKLNAIAKTTKYKMHNMIFDDLLDTSGIDLIKSAGLTHDSTNGKIHIDSIETWISKLEGDVDPISKGWTQGNSSNPAGLTLNEGSLMVTGDPTVSYSGIRFTGSWSGYRQGMMKIRFRNIDSTYIRIRTYGGYGLAEAAITPAAEKLVISSEYTQDGFNSYEWHELTLETQAYPVNKVRATLDGVEIYYGLANSTNTAKLFDVSTKGTIEIDYLYIANTFTPLEGDFAILIGKTETTDAVPLKAILTVEEGAATLTGRYFVSRDDGVSWEAIIPEELFNFTDGVSPMDNKLRLKAELPLNTQLLNYALTWA